jgi:isobutyryl-CoA mutase
MPCAMSAARWCATARPSAPLGRTCRSSAPPPARFNDDGVTALYQYLKEALVERGLKVNEGQLPHVEGKQPTGLTTVVPPARTRYLSDIAETIRSYHSTTASQAQVASTVQHLETARALLAESGSGTGEIDALIAKQESELLPTVKAMLDEWPAMREAYREEELVVKIRDKEMRNALWRQTLSGNRIPRVALPRTNDAGDQVTFLREENLPGLLPVHRRRVPLQARGRGTCSHVRRRRRPGSAPTVASTCLASGQPATRLSTAFDSVTLYGRDPDERPDIYGKVGTSGRLDRDPRRHEGSCTQASISAIR